MKKNKFSTKKTMNGRNEYGRICAPSKKYTSAYRRSDGTWVRWHCAEDPHYGSNFREVNRGETITYGWNKGPVITKEIKVKKGLVLDWDMNDNNR